MKAKHKVSKKSKQIIVISLYVFSLIAGCVFFLTNVFAQKGTEVMKRYDYSSPKTSFESFQKAAKNNDLEGVLIHFWQESKTVKSSPAYGLSFEQFLIKAKEQPFIKNGSREKALECYKKLKESNPNLLVMTQADFEKDWPSAMLILQATHLGLGLGVLDFKFVKEEYREDNEKYYGFPATGCWLVLERLSNHEEYKGMATATNFSPNKEWWITLSPSGE